MLLSKLLGCMRLEPRIWRCLAFLEVQEAVQLMSRAPHLAPWMNLSSLIYIYIYNKNDNEKKRVKSDEDNSNNNINSHHSDAT